MKMFCKVLICSIVFLCTKHVHSQDINPANWSSLTGYWKFQESANLTKATVGNNLILNGTHKIVPGPAYGDTAVRIGIGSYYKAYHNIKPNGGGNNVNNYTLLIDFMVQDVENWHTFFQTDTTNSNDGEGFIRPKTESNPGTIGTAATQYTKDSIRSKEWYRLVISVSLGNFYRYYLNGKLVLEGDIQSVDGRFSLQNNVLFFADNNQEDDDIDIASIAVFNKSLSATEVASLGTLNPCIENPPAVNLGKDTFVCNNQTISINAGDFKQYSWYTGQITQVAEFSAKNLNPGKNNVYIRVVDVNNCLARDTVVIELLAAPKADLGPDRTVCFGTPVILEADTISSHQYIWKELTADSVVSTQNTYSVTRTGTYAVFIISANGCVGSDTVNIKVNIPPQKPVVTYAGSSEICFGDSIVLNGPATSNSYSWSNGATTQSITVRNTQQLRLRLRDSNGCYSQWSDTIKVNINPVPIAPILQASGSLVFCQGDSVILYTANGYAEYIWNDGSDSSARVIKTSGIYHVAVKTAVGCQSSISNSIEVRVLPVPQMPVLNITDDVHLCSGETVELSGPAGLDEYLWSNGSTTNSITVSESGNYTLMVKDGTGCWSHQSAPTMVKMHSAPAKPILTITGHSIQSTNLNSKHIWYFNNQMLPDSLNLINVNKSGYYKAMVFNDTCYSEMSDSVEYINTGIRSNSITNNVLQLNPNPAGLYATVKLPGISSAGRVNIFVFDVQGKKMLETNTQAAELNNGKMLDLQQLKPGIYFVQVVTGNQIYITKLHKISM